MKIFYVWDPLCGWCYAFKSVIFRLMDEFSPVFDFAIISGGMAIGDKVMPVSEKAVYIKRRLPDVERIGGVKFGTKYIRLLDEGTAISDSLPPSIAFKVFLSFRKDLSLDWAWLIQEALFNGGKALNNIKVYLEIAEKHDINKFAFMDRFGDPAFRKSVEDDFSLARSWGVNQFPSLVLQKGPRTEILKRGYAAYDELSRQLRELAED
ncbi:MAG TPA: DsbA family protein [Cyclobacteriaceae bacterium]|nr:DsbA family protein [Cyclobacteriaceae bacterium]